MRRLLIGPFLAEVEHVVVSNVQKVIPEQVKTKWHEWRHGKETVHKDAVIEGETAGWGVREADERTAQEGASKYPNINLVRQEQLTC